MSATESEGSQEVQNQVVFVENSFDELRREVPVTPDSRRYQVHP
jgi:hypothetical protein